MANTIIPSTPLMQQYCNIKSHYTDALLLFRVGDFYELFYEDAITASAFLGIALTARNKESDNPVPFCGVPIHTKDHYISKLVKGGFNVALCDQLEPARPGAVVQRGVTQVLTPGTLVESTLLDEKKSSYLLAIFASSSSIGLVFGEIVSGQLYITSLPATQKSIDTELSRFLPDEIILSDNLHTKQYIAPCKQWGYTTTIVQSSSITNDSFDLWIQKQCNAQASAHLTDHTEIKNALLLFYRYIERNQKQSLEHCMDIAWYKPDDFLMLDATTQRNLELLSNTTDGSTKNTLLVVLDHAQTPMGSRLIRTWITHPLIHKEPIIERQECVEFFIQHSTLYTTLLRLLKSIGDLERIIGRIALDKAALHDFIQLKRILETLPEIAQTINHGTANRLLKQIQMAFVDFNTLYVLLAQAINTDETKSWIIAHGFDHQLDTMRALIAQNTHNMSALEKKEQELTGIPSLKITYNAIHGYYIEITKSYLDQVPERYIRKQTLVGKERFITQELQARAYEIDRTYNGVAEYEKQLFHSVKSQVKQYMYALRTVARELSILDALMAFATVAKNNNYHKPDIRLDTNMYIEQGKHPILAAKMPECFIANDTLFCDTQSTLIITGPNMGGKSTYLRQVALLTLLTQIGSFIPAKHASMPLIDRIFTRIGSGDKLAEGKSTFLVEMEETARICVQATAKSLVILDEVGRGTSTFDGLAIAQAVVEFISNTIKARCLFASHYHELTKLHALYPHITNYYANSIRYQGKITFLYTIEQGISDGSFGIEVAKLAELPRPILDRAQELLKTFSIQQ